MIPIVLGVTGHRDIRADDIPSLRAAIFERLEVLSEEFPHSQFVLLNGIAIGADSIFFDIATKFERVQITAVLPFDEEEYRKDFTGPCEAQSFEERLRLSSDVVNASEGLVLECRNDGYVNVGRAIVERAHILFCLWDGTDADAPKPGGTANVIEMAKSHTERCDDIGENLGVQIEHLFALRERNAPEFIEANKYKIAKWTSERLNERLLNALKQIDVFNCRSQKVSEAAISKSISYLYGSHPKPDHCDANKALEHTYACADVMASQHQKWRKRGIFWVSMVGFLAVLSMQIFQSFGYASFWIASYFVLSVVAVAIYIMLFRGPASHERNLLEWRSLAECLRVQNFWYICGVDDDVCDHYLADDASELLWLRTAIKAVQPAGNRTEDPAAMTYAMDIWIGGQFRYFTKQARANLDLESKYNNLIFLFLSFGLISVVTLTVAHFSYWRSEWIEISSFLSGIFFLIAASLKAYASYMGFGILSKKYYSSAKVMEGALKQLTTLSKRAEWTACQTNFKQIGKFALAENSNWLRSHRERQFEMSLS